eukprot:356757-Pleurochrysis_carterae.AAC.2
MPCPVEAVRFRRTQRKVWAVPSHAPRREHPVIGAGRVWRGVRRRRQSGYVPGPCDVVRIGCCDVLELKPECGERLRPPTRSA